MNIAYAANKHPSTANFTMRFLHLAFFIFFCVARAYAVPCLVADDSASDNDGDIASAR